MKKRNYMNCFIMVLIACGLTCCDSSKRDWDKAEKANTIETYEQFLLDHKDSKFAGPAIKEIELLNWDKVQTLNTVEEYTLFMKKYPQSEFTEKAKEKMAKLRNYYFKRKGYSGANLYEAQKNGNKLIEGIINGLVVQKGETKVSKAESDTSKLSYNVSYILINGKDILAINEEGLHKKSEAVIILNVSQEDMPPDDIEVINIGLKQEASGFFSSPVSMNFTSAGGTVIRIEGRTNNKLIVSQDTILGEVRIDPLNHESRINQELEITTDQGIVRVPAKNFVRFKVQE